MKSARKFLGQKTFSSIPLSNGPQTSAQNVTIYPLSPAVLTNAIFLLVCNSKVSKRRAVSLL